MTSQDTTLIDLSHTIEDGIITYKGLPAPIICDFLSRKASREHYAPEEEETQIDVDHFQRIDPRGKAVLVHTGWSRHWRTDQYFEGHPYLTEAVAVFLRDNEAALVGIDSLNIDGISDRHRPVHTTLLGANIPIAEHLTNLNQVPDQGFRFYAAPVKVKNLGTFPVRAFAVVE